VIAVVPARYGSSRLPAKALADIAGVPMVVRVWRQASKANSIARVIVATDDERIAAPVRGAGGEAMLTSPDHQSGTDRIAEVASKVIADIYIGVQGDQPFIAPEDLDALASAMHADAHIKMGTLATPIIDQVEWTDPNKVKVVCEANGNALYFSRSPIPYARDGGMPKGALRHIGVYAYRRDFLMKFAAFGVGVLESVEKLEQLRALEHGYRIKVVKSAAPSMEVDTADDLVRAREATKVDSAR
jgi:3-deoxy-D-manno-octulosonate cytidylyltransferase